MDAPNMAYPGFAGHPALDAYFLATSGIVLLSASRRVFTMCSSVNRLFLRRPSVWAGGESSHVSIVPKFPEQVTRPCPCLWGPDGPFAAPSVNPEEYGQTLHHLA